MKKHLLLAALTVVALTSCKKEAEVDNETIRIAANVVNIPTNKAPIGENPGETKTFIPTVLGWEVAANNAPDYTVAPSWSAETDGTVSAVASENQELLLMNPSQTYKYGKVTNVFAFYPQGTCANGVVTFTNIAPDGTSDVLIADKANGSLAQKLTGLSFRHPLTQFKFVVASTGKNHAAKLNGITLIGVALPMSINVSDGTLNYQNSDNLSVPDINEIAITTTGNPCGSPIMVGPLSGKTIPLIVYTTDSGVDGIPVTATVVGDKIEANTAYTITLTFVGDTEIKASASVQNWADGSGGGAVS